MAGLGKSELGAAGSDAYQWAGHDPSP
jgi:hypothetical protein